MEDVPLTFCGAIFKLSCFRVVYLYSLLLINVYFPLIGVAIGLLAGLGSFNRSRAQILNQWEAQNGVIYAPVPAVAAPQESARETTSLLSNQV